MLIAQLTDTHIKKEGHWAYNKVDTLGLLKAAIKHLNELSGRPDVVLVTGDLVDMGTEDEYRLIRTQLDQLKMPWLAIPGNHDDRAAMQACFCDQAWMPVNSDFIQYAVDDYPLRLVGLDSIIPGSGGGEFCQERCDWLDNILAEEANKDTLLFIHHPPYKTGIAFMDGIRLKDDEGLASVIKRHSQVKMLLCGHVHRAVQSIWNGIPAVIGPSPAHAVTLDTDKNADSSFILEPPAIQLIRYSEGQLTTHLSYIGAFSGPWPFCHPDGSLID